MARCDRVRWQCPSCGRQFLRQIVTARHGEIAPLVRADGFDSRCPKCGHLDLVLSGEAEALVVAVMYDIAD